MFVDVSDTPSDVIVFTSTVFETPSTAISRPPTTPTPSADNDNTRSAHAAPSDSDVELRSPST